MQATIEQAMALAVRHHQAGRLGEAQSLYRQVLAYQPDHPHALQLLGVVTHQLGQSDAAIDLLRRAIAIEPREARYHFNLANVFHDRRQVDDAIAAYREACRLDPQFTAAHRKLAVELLHSGRAREAAVAFESVAKLEPHSAHAQNDLGVALVAAGLLDRSTTAFRAAIRLDPNHAEAHNGLGGNLLLQGDFELGWPEYEWRWRGQGATSTPPNFQQPQWRGENVEGKTILLHADQGFGDSIQFVRYIPLVAAGGATILLQCPPELRRLFQSVPGIHEMFLPGQILRKFDFHCPLASLPLAFGTTIQSIPATVPYISAAARTDLPSGFKVGIAWSGRPAHANDANRSIPIKQFEPLSIVQNVALHSVQKDSPPSDTAFELIDHSKELTDFADTASLIAALDLVISADTAVAHLAGAMGKPTWLLLPYSPDWRWLLNRDDSPWYPTMRLFRQPVPGDWQSVIQRVADELPKQI
jgi:Flp pilus assembly protein TadD